MGRPVYDTTDAKVDEGEGVYRDPADEAVRFLAVQSGWSVRRAM